jgi:hypothetical protein
MSAIVLTSETLIGTPAPGNIEYNGQFFGTDSAGSRAQLQRLVLSTAVASTSGTSIDFNSIPAWVKKITVMFQGVSTNGTSYKQIRFTDSALKTSGYSSTSSLIYGSNLCVVAAASTGFFIRSDQASEALDGCYVFNLLNSSNYKWSSFGNMSDGSGRTWQQSGAVTMASAVTAVRITTVNGTDTFDAGSVNIMYEG